MAAALLDVARSLLERADDGGGLRVSRVTIWETPQCCATVEA
jgi:hypothetical protein